MDQSVGVRHQRTGFPVLGLGLGLRGPHHSYVLERLPPVGWFEVISENVMDTQGRPWEVLKAVREQYPIVMHGVSMNIASTDPLDVDYLRRLRVTRDEIGAAWVSDHLCWTGVQGMHTHQLLPTPYTEEMLRHTARRVREVQHILEAPLVLENPSSYFEYTSSTMHEADFLRHLCDESGCALLLDVNNVYVSAFNHDLDAFDYLDRIPHERVVQYHLAGHTHKGDHILDTHSAPVIDAVWELFAASWPRVHGLASVMVEWDEDIPDFDTVWGEALKARELMDKLGNQLAPSHSSAGEGRG